MMNKPMKAAAKPMKGAAKPMKGAAKPMSYQKGGMVFKTCSSCPNPAKCKAMGKCMTKGKK